MAAQHGAVLKCKCPLSTHSCHYRLPFVDVSDERAASLRSPEVLGPRVNPEWWALAQMIISHVKRTHGAAPSGFSFRA